MLKAFGQKRHTQELGRVRNSVKYDDTLQSKLPLSVQKMTFPLLTDSNHPIHFKSVDIKDVHSAALLEHL